VNGDAFLSFTFERLQVKEESSSNQIHLRARKRKEKGSEPW